MSHSKEGRKAALKEPSAVYQRAQVRSALRKGIRSFNLVFEADRPMAQSRRFDLFEEIGSESSTMESLRYHVSRLPPSVQRLLLEGLVAFSASPIGIILGILLDLSRRLHRPHPQAAQLNSNYNEDDLDRVSYADIDMLNAIPREPTHAGYVVIGGSGFVGRCVSRPLHRVK